MFKLLLILFSVIKPSQIKGNALILFDPIASPKSEYSYYVLDLYELENLLGHFKFIYYHEPTNEYTKGDIFNYDAVFYMGEVDNSYINPDLLKDLLKYKKPVVWFKKNINNFSFEVGANMRDQFGFVMDSLSIGYFVNGKAGFYRNVTYKGITFQKWFKVYPGKKEPEWDPEVAVTHILDSSKAEVIATIKWWGYGKPRRDEIPYIIRVNNFWYVAGDPMSFIATYTPYTIFCDLLHDMLNQQHSYPPRALVRLEDIAPTLEPSKLRKVVKYLYSHNIPFAMAVIPIYKNPYNDKVVYLHEAKGLVEALKYAVNHGGYIFMHGTSHQQDITTWQKYNISALAYEYFDFDTKIPVPGDNMMWVYQRIKKGLKEFQLAGLPVSGFEVPHYSASRMDFFIFGKMFDLNYHRPALYMESPDGVMYENQFFPYVIYWDIYGETLIPENLGYISNYLNDVRPPDSVIAHARYLLAVRDGIASFFWHPSLADYTDAEHFYGIESLKKVIRGLKAMGYTFVSPVDLPELKEYFSR